MKNKNEHKEMKMGKNMLYDDYMIEEHWRIGKDGWESFLISDIVKMVGCGPNTIYFMINGDEFRLPDTIGETGLKFPGNHMRSDDKSTIINFHHIIFPLELIDGEVAMAEGIFAHVSRRGEKTFSAAVLRFILKKGIKNIRKSQSKKKKGE